MKETPVMILYMPVIHQGYLNVLEAVPRNCQICLLEPSLVAEILGIHADPATLLPTECQSFLVAKGFSQVTVLPAREQKVAVAELLTKITAASSVHWVDDQVSRHLWESVNTAAIAAAKAVPEVVWHTVFLRWDSQSVQRTEMVGGLKTTDEIHRKWMREAKKIADKSSDWWRQVGAIVVKNSSEVMRTYNQGMTDDHTPYQYGAVRDFVAVGTAPELANYMHAEQVLIAQAAANGVGLAGADFYVTHFPCPVCAKLIAKAGLKRVFFAVGSATLDGQSVLEQSGVELCQVVEETDAE